MIRILNADQVRLANITKAITATHIEEINGAMLLNFSAILTDKLTDLLNADGTMLECYDDYYDIVLMKQMSNDDGTYTVDVESEHVSYRLNNPDYEYHVPVAPEPDPDAEEPVETPIYSFQGVSDPAATLQLILDNTLFTVGTVEPTKDCSMFRYTRDVTSRQLLTDLADYIEGEILCDKFEISIVTKRGDQTPKLAIKGRNIRNISKEINKRKNADKPVSYQCDPVGIPEDAYAVGDQIILVDRMLRVREALRVIRIERDPYNPINLRMTFGHYINGLEEDFYNNNMGWKDAVTTLEETVEEKIDEKVEESKESAPKIFYFYPDTVDPSEIEARLQVNTYPTGGKCRFERRENGMRIIYEAYLAEDDRIIEEPTDPDTPAEERYEQLLSPRDLPVYFTQWSGTDAYKYGMTTVPYDIYKPPIPPEYSSHDERQEWIANYNQKYAVNLRKILTERVVGRYGAQNDDMYLSRMSQTLDESGNPTPILDDSGNPVLNPDGSLTYNMEEVGIRTNGSVPEYTKEGVWTPIGSGGGKESEDGTGLITTVGGDDIAFFAIDHELLTTDLDQIPDDVDRVIIYEYDPTILITPLEPATDP